MGVKLANEFRNSEKVQERAELPRLIILIYQEGRLQGSLCEGFFVRGIKMSAERDLIS